jgi:N-acetylglucosaminyldiphosphoundecaprenol N-acetyl-beta-D-mannosaminyltransferase
MMSKTSKKADNTAQIFNIAISSNSKDQVLSAIASKVESGTPRDILWINTPTVEQVVSAQTDDTFRHILNSSNFSLPDGAGLIAAINILHFFKKLPKNSPKVGSRIVGIDFMQEVIKLAAKKDKKVFLLGGIGKTGKLAAKKLKIDYPNLKISSWSGSENIAKESLSEHRQTLEKIRSFKTDILFVAFGAPWQEAWIYSNRKQLAKAGVKVAMVVGGSLDIISGNLTRAPKILRLLGLEWSWRLMLEPSRIKRQIRLITFIRMVAKSLITAKNNS